MSIVYRSMKITVSDANTWFYKTLYLDKKIGRILRAGASSVASRIDFRVLIPGNTLSHKVSLYNGSENILDSAPIGQLYDGEDSINGISSRYLMDLNGKEGIPNTYGYLQAGVILDDKALLPDMGLTGMKTENYLLFAPWYEIRDPSKPVDPVLNPVVFKYPYDIAFRFECEI